MENSDQIFGNSGKNFKSRPDDLMFDIHSLFSLTRKAQFRPVSRVSVRIDPIFWNQIEQFESIFVPIRFEDRLGSTRIGQDPSESLA